MIILITESKQHEDMLSNSKAFKLWYIDFIINAPKRVL